MGGILSAQETRKFQPLNNKFGKTIHKHMFVPSIGGYLTAYSLDGEPNRKQFAGVVVSVSDECKDNQTYGSTRNYNGFRQNVERVVVRETKIGTTTILRPFILATDGVWLASSHEIQITCENDQRICETVPSENDVIPGHKEHHWTRVAYVI
jgi:hypothetical protein